VTYRNIGAGIALVVGLACGGALATAQAPKQTPPDNTKVNTRDRAAKAQTADQQGNSKADVERTRQIRRAIVADKALSTYAHNVKVITRDGHVTLKGPVQTADEKAAVEAKATEVAGAGNVTNQISVKASSKKTGKDE